MKLMGGYIIKPDHNLTDTYRLVNRSWIDRIFSLTPWRSQELVRIPAYIDNGREMWVSLETYKELTTLNEENN